ncbi:phage tail protein [Pseudomonas chlororaphis]|uniref:Phage tail protein n=1 Tax=Pseudomonas chlororaphis TaxID=587753 RepID=A0A1Q8EUE9_9PSED|nr:phage tail protein [Pseudomonas chlororaphis]OLF55402.1 hypothetical protein BTN82_05505 [Pseudomonas chlororaphis]
MADYYTLLTNAGIAYETACKAAGVPIKLSQISVGDGGGAVYNPAATDTALKREVWRGPLNALFQDEKNPSWLLAEVTIPPEVGGWYVREAGLWTDSGILYAIVKYPESFKPVLATSGSGKEFYIRSIFETSNASLVTLLIDDTVVKATRAWVAGYVADELAKLDAKQSVRAATTGNIVLSSAQMIDGVAVLAGDRVLVKNQTLAKDNGIYVVANELWTRAKDADASIKVTPNLTVSVEEGTTLADTRWQLVTDGVIVLGTTALKFQNVTQGFAPLNSPALIFPTANTPAQFDVSQALVNTHFLKRRGFEYSSFTSNDVDTNMTAIHIGGFHIFSKVTPITAVLPATAQVAQGATITVASSNVGEVTIAAAAGDILFTSTGFAGPLVMAIGDTAEFIKLEGQWRLIGGTLALRFAGVMSSPSFKTRPQFDNSKAFATTEFVARALGNFRGGIGVLASRTLTDDDLGKRLELAAGVTVAMPATSSVPDGAAVLISAGPQSTSSRVTVAAGDQLAMNNLAVTVPYTLSPGGDFIAIREANVWRCHSGSETLRSSPLFAASMATSGYQKLPSGLILQWGTFSVVASSTDQTITLPIAFPVTFHSVVATSDYTPNSGVVGTVAATLSGSLASFIIRCSYGTSTRWFALGK